MIAPDEAGFLTSTQTRPTRCLICLAFPALPSMTLRCGRHRRRTRVALKVIQNPADGQRGFNAADELESATAGALLNVDPEHPLEPLRPRHGLMSFCCCLRCLGWPLAPTF